VAGQYADGLDENGQWTAETGNSVLDERGAIVDLGQVPAWMKKQLDAAAKAGRLVKYRGHFDSLLSFAGMGPKKVIWADPEIAEAAGAWGGTVSGRYPFPATVMIGERPAEHEAA